jgi:glycosyltransferase involved in cell wall biosynthesis
VGRLGLASRSVGGGGACWYVPRMPASEIGGAHRLATADALRVLYSFPHRIGAGRICYTAWEQARGVAVAGASIRVLPASVARPLPPGISVEPTLERVGIRLPYRIVGQLRALVLHDWLVARQLRRIAHAVDVVHAWPLGALETLRTADELGIPTVLERPNAHTRFAYEVVRDECERLGVELPPDHEHAYNETVLAREELEYDAADYLLCPSDFVVETFVDQGVEPRKLLRHVYGYDPVTFYPDPDPAPRSETNGLTMLYVGVAAVRKGLHFALEAWLRSPASAYGTFLIAGEMLPSYGAVLAEALEHPSVQMLGHRTDIPELMRRSDILVLPSIEEGFGLVCTEAMGSGCVPLVSRACTELCRHLENSLVHEIGDVDALTMHITMLHQDQALLGRLRSGCLQMAPEVTWDAAGVSLVDAYRQAVLSAARSAASLTIA